jgi:hypothetical protein
LEENVYFVGTCPRDERERFVKAFSKRFVGVPEIAEAEAWGVREALHWLSTMDVENAIIEIESGCLQVVQSINAKHTTTMNST